MKAVRSSMYDRVDEDRKDCVDALADRMTHVRRCGHVGAPSPALPRWRRGRAWPFGPAPRLRRRRTASSRPKRIRPRIDQITPGQRAYVQPRSPTAPGPI